MGFLTTFTIYNDGLSTIRENPLQFAEQVVFGASQHASASESYAVGNHCNLVRVQRSRHADDWAVYVHAGNTVVNLTDDYEGRETVERLADHNRPYLEQMLAFMERNCRKLRELLEKIDEKKKAQSTS